jgi:hypothetical protein
MSALPGPPGRWLLIRQGPLAPEERAVLDAVRRRLRAEHRSFVTVLLGTSSYDGESSPAGSNDREEEWLLDDDARGRGIHSPVGAALRIVTADELAVAVMTAERVIQFP